MSKTNRVTSRLVKREQKKLMRQTAMFAGVSIVIIALFIFVILPGFLGLVDRMLNNNPFQEEDTIPPQVPIISAPPTATNSADIVIEGYGEPESEVQLLLNALKATAVVIGPDGDFRIETQLQEGENTIELYATDQAGNKSNNTRTYVAILDTQNPDIEISKPSDEEKFVGSANQDVVIEGKTEPKSRVYINDRMVLPNNEGSFNYTYRLSEGKNEIEIKVVDQGGNESEQSLTLEFSL